MAANLGALAQLNNDHSIGLDVFYLEMENVVSIDYEAVTQAELDGVDLSQYGISVNRDAGGRISSACH